VANWRWLEEVGVSFHRVKFIMRCTGHETQEAASPHYDEIRSTLIRSALTRFDTKGFIVTNLETDSRAVVRFYNKRGTAEQWIKEGKQAVKMTWLSCHRFRSNEVRLWLSVMAYNLGNLWRWLLLPNRIDN